MQPEELIHHIHRTNHIVSELAKIVGHVIPQVRHTNRQPVQIDIGETSGMKPVSSQFPAKYVGILNNTGATLFLDDGQQSVQSLNAVKISPGQYLSIPWDKEQERFTVFWSSESEITADNNTFQVIFSNTAIDMYSGTL